jgi:hypothetical protein
MRANDMAVLSDEHFHLRSERLGPRRGRPFEKDRLIDRVQTNIPNPITEWPIASGGGMKSASSRCEINSIVCTRNFSSGLPPSVTSTSRARLRP